MKSFPIIETVLRFTNAFYFIQLKCVRVKVNILLMAYTTHGVRTQLISAKKANK